MNNINKYFRFRFISRGEVANKLTQISVKSLQHCHPGILLTVIDANDIPQLKVEDFPEVHLVHIIPCNDEIAQRVGRGTLRLYCQQFLLIRSLPFMWIVILFLSGQWIYHL